MIDVRSFARPGTLADGISDWAGPIQEAIDCLLSYRMSAGNPLDPDGEPKRAVRYGTLHLPAGIYRISRPLLVLLVEHDVQDGKSVKTLGFCGIEIVGDAAGSADRARGASHASIIRADFNDRPALLVQGASPLRLRNLVIEGQNDWAHVTGRDPRNLSIHANDDNYYVRPRLDVLTVPRAGGVMLDFPRSPGLLPAAGATLLVQARFDVVNPRFPPLDPNLPLDPCTRQDLPLPPTPSFFGPPPRDNPNSPYAGVCVDPFSPLVRVENRYPDMKDLYETFYFTRQEDGSEMLNLAASTEISMDHCLIRGFVTGVVVTPGGVPGAEAGGQLANAENIRISNTTIESTVSAVVICQTQSRNVVLSNVNILGAKYAVNCADYGQGVGNCPSIFGADIAGVKYLLHMTPAGSAYALHGVRAQDIWALGQIAGGRAVDPVTFDGCHFRFGAASACAPRIEAHLLNKGHAVFRGCVLEKPAALDPDPTLLLTNVGRLSFQGCRFHTAAQDAPPLWVLVSGDSAQVRYEGCLLSTPQGITPWADIVESQAQVRMPLLPGALVHHTRRFFDLDRHLVVVHALHWARSNFPKIELGTGSLQVDAHGRGIFVAGETYGILRGRLRPGDLLFTDNEVPGVYLPGIDPDLRAPFARAEKIVIGRFRSLGTGADAEPAVVFFDRAPLSLIAALRAAPMQRLALFGSYVPRWHPPSLGLLRKEVPQQLSSVFAQDKPFGDAWKVGDRILSPRILVGTYITHIVGGEVFLSREADVASLATEEQWIRLFDADMRELRQQP